MINKAKDFPFTQSQSKIELNDSTIEKFQASEPTKPNAYVEVKATGKGLTYQWYVKFKDSEDWKELADSNVSRYYIGSLKGVSREFDGAKFKCKVSNSKGSVISDEVTLTVAEEEMPAITAQPVNQTVDPGEYDALTKRRFAKYVIAVNGSGSGGGTTADEHNKGWFTEPSALPTTGENGDYAIIGTTDTVWVWDSDSNSWVDTGSTNTVKTVNGIGPDDHGEITLSAKDVNTYTTTELDTRITSLNSKILTKEDKLNYYEEQDGASYIITKASETTKNGGHIKFEAKGGETDAGFIDIDAKRQTTGEGGEISIIAESKSADATQDSAINIQADKINLTGLVKINQQEIQSVGTVKSVNSQKPDENGNVKLIAANIEDISLTKGGNDLAVIKIGELELSALTPDSIITADKVDGTVLSATKTSQDSEGNVISTTYATKVSLNGVNAAKANIDATNISSNNLVSWKSKLGIDAIETTLSDKQDISNLVTDINSASTDTTYPSAKIVYNSINAVDSKVKAIISTVGDENSGLVKTVSTNVSNIATLKTDKQDKTFNIGEQAYTVEGLLTETKNSLDQTYIEKANNGIVIKGQSVIPLTVDSKIDVDKITGLTKASVGLGNVDNTSDADKPISTAVQTALDKKQDKLTTYTETKVDDKNNVAISGSSITLNGALMGNCISDTISGNAATDKIKVPTVAAVYDAVQYLKVTSTINATITPASVSTATAITDALAKPARVVVNPNIGNTGAVYIQESDTYSTVNPIYPDPTNNVYEFSNMQNVKIFVDNLGDSVDLRIEYRG